MINTPYFHQTDPAKAPGQIVNPVQPTLYLVKRGTLAEYITRVQVCEMFHADARRLVQSGNAA